MVIVRSTHGSDLKRVKIKKYRKLIYEHCLRWSYNFGTESYIRKALHSSLVFCKLDICRESIVTLALS